MIIQVFKKNYEACIKQSEDMWAKNKSGYYGRGIKNSDSDPYKVQRAGCIGEMALGIFLGMEPNFIYIHGGDREDFTLPNGKRVDIKIAFKDYGANCIKFINEYGKPVFSDNKPPCDFYVGAVLISDDYEEKVASVDLKGFITKKEFDLLPVVKPRAPGRWKNKELVHKNLRPISELLDEKN